MEKEVQINKNARSNKLSGFVIIACLVFSIVIGYNSFLEEKRIGDIDSQIQYYNSKIESLNDEKEQIKKEISNSSNSEYIEEIARNKLDMFLPNDTVYIFGD